MPWRAAMARALYGPGGFFVSGPGPADHFRTSVHAAPAFAAALFRLVERVDAALGHPDRLDVVDVGAGRGELLVALAGLAARPTPDGPGAPDAAPGSGGLPDRPGRPRPDPVPAGAAGPVPLARRLRLTAVELAPRPAGLPAAVGWAERVPTGITGLLLATEWLDNVPLDVAGWTPDGWRYLLVDPATGTETVGGPVSPADADWLAAWWPPPGPAPAGPADPAAGPAPTGVAGPAGGGATGPTPDGPGSGYAVTARAEIGRTRDEAWAAAVRRIDRGLALAVDYGHVRAGRPHDGTLTGYRGGRQVHPVPDGSCDVTAHVAVDSVGAAGAAVAGTAYTLVDQRAALRALGADGGRPPLALASTDPAGYVRALAAAGAVAELTDPAGLGGHWWLRQPVGVDRDPFMAR
ncbi:hypothetical protein AWW66_24130 [Micromonospora rosaria]|uniref:SAM-dependent methyltransferase n=2 Tax=Micromonospora rosaria TaxID=47874 RepID=A0A136PMF5_9ACTN|nr:hypothetical protein AWW66_24130 [Micromonospora rosaria]